MLGFSILLHGFPVLHFCTLVSIVGHFVIALVFPDILVDFCLLALSPLFGTAALSLWVSHRQGLLADVFQNTSEGQVRQAVCLFLMQCIIKR